MMSDESPCQTKSGALVAVAELEGFGDMDGVGLVVLEPRAADVAFRDRSWERASDHATVRQLTVSGELAMDRTRGAYLGFFHCE